MGERPADLVYGLDDVPPPARLVALGFQYAILIAVYLILVVLVARAAGASPDETANLVSLALVAAAIGTVAQAWNGRFFGSGYLAPPVYSAIYFAPALLAAKAGGLPAVAGMTIFAGLVEIGLSRLIDRLRIVFQPTIAGLTVLIVGLQLGIVGAGHALDLAGLGSPDFDWDIAAAFITLAACIAFSIWGRGVVRLISTLLGLVVGILAGIASGLIGTAVVADIAAAGWIALPDPTRLSFGFEPALIPAFIAAAIAATLRTIGVVTSCQQLNDADWKRPDIANLSRGVAADGIGAVVAGLLGALGQSSGPSLVGVSKATGATSRAIAFAAAAILIVLAFLPKFGAAIIALPLEIAGALLVFTAAFIVVGGIQILAVRGLDLRGGFAVSLALFAGLMALTQPHYFAGLPPVLQTITSDMLTVSLAVAIALTLVFRIGIHRTEATQRQAADAALAEFHGLLDREQKSWKLAGDTVERARNAVTDLVGRLKDGCFDGPLAIASSFDELELMVELTYRGRPPDLSPRPDGRRLTHQEAPMVAGLAGLAQAIEADRTSVAARGGEVEIRLWFAS